MGGEVLARLLERLDDLVAGLDDRGCHDVHGPADDGHDGDAGEPGGDGPIDLGLHQPPVQRPEQRRTEQRQQHGHDGRTELHGQPDPDVDDPGDQQYDDTPGGEPPDGVGEQRGGGLHAPSGSCARWGCRVRADRVSDGGPGE
ncbi:hypothetical protein GCM10022233_44940 [Streptomyces shaanxiensis]|uniref:Uncharacterized protein n=1 Tax=Streptomyces shaanxiensis TaxID=653357 RepID=A0ABP7VE74_9ACTN